MANVLDIRNFFMRPCNGLAVAIAGLVFILSAGCSSTPQPEPIHVGEDICANCRMAIIEPQFVSEIILSSGEALKFDDLACLASGAKNAGPVESRHIFVQDYYTRQWISRDHAVIVLSSNVQTPMGSGHIAFGSRAQAEKFLAEHVGQLIGLQDFLRH
jgi:copper chaperone NosL